jgi:hypothetical protein
MKSLSKGWVDKVTNMVEDLVYFCPDPIQNKTFCTVSAVFLKYFI